MSAFWKSLCLLMLMLLQATEEKPTSTTEKPALTTEKPAPAAPVLTNDEVHMDGSPEFVARQLPGLLKLLARQVIEANQKSLRQISADIAKGSEKILDAVKRLPQCPVPWTKFGSLCLLFVQEEKTWSESERFCRSKGGHLGWLESASERKTANAFAKKYPNKKSYNWYRIGLHRATKNGPLQWSSGSRSAYRGSPFTDNDKYMAFYADKTSRQIDGNKPSMKTPFLCRMA